MTAHIISIAQFDCVEPIRVLFQSQRYSSQHMSHWSESNDALEQMIYEIIFPKNGNSQCLKNLTIRGMIDYSLKLIGHTLDDDTEKWSGELIASSSRGQVVFPAIFDSLLLNGSNLSRLAGAMGQLRHGKTLYDMARTTEDEVEALEYETHDEPVDRPCNLYEPHNVRVPWSVETGSRNLYVRLQHSELDLTASPMACLSGLEESLFVP